MSKALFINFPAFGHVNPTLGLASELVRRGEKVDYSCAESFRKSIEQTGAVFKNYGGIPDQAFSFGQSAPDTGGKGIAANQSPSASQGNPYLNQMIGFLTGFCAYSFPIVSKMIADIGDTKYDYIVKDSLYPFASILAQILGIPAVSSFAAFTSFEDLCAFDSPVNVHEIMADQTLSSAYEKTRIQFSESYHITLPDLPELFYNKTELNIVYTSYYFLPHKDHYDESFVFIGPPINDIQENIDFPFEKLKGKKVIYISMGTLFSDNVMLYDLFFQAFENTDYTVVMPAYHVDLSQFTIPSNFIVREFVPQTEILKYAKAAIIHGGINSLSDVIYHEIPFVSIPIGADQPANAYRASDLGASITLDIKSLTPDIIRDSVNRVIADDAFKSETKKIGDSFKTAGGYKRAADEIFRLKAKYKL